MFLIINFFKTEQSRTDEWIVMIEMKQRVHQCDAVYTVTMQIPCEEEGSHTRL